MAIKKSTSTSAKKSTVSHETTPTKSKQAIDVESTEKSQNELVKDELTVDTAKYPLAYVPAKIDFSGQKKLEQDIDKIVELFSGEEVTADYAKQARRERAHINKIISAIKESQQRVVGVVASDILKWEDGNKKQIKRLEELSNNLKNGIDKWAQIEKEDKHRQNLIHIKKMLESNGYGESYIPKIEKDFYNSKWDNKTFSFATFEKEVNQIISKFKDDDNRHAEDVKIIVDTCQKTKSRLGAEHWIEELDSGKSLSVVLDEIAEYDQSVQDAITHSYQADNVAEQPNSTSILEVEQIDDTAPLAKVDDTVGDELMQEEPVIEEPQPFYDEPLPDELTNDSLVNSEMQSEPTTYVAGNKVIDSETGEIIEDCIDVKLSLHFTRKQLKTFIPILQNFIDANNIDYSHVKLVEEI